MVVKQYFGFWIDFVDCVMDILGGWVWGIRCIYDCFVIGIEQQQVICLDFGKVYLFWVYQEVGIVFGNGCVEVVVD